jgi:hypothetical protein
VALTIDSWTDYSTVSNLRRWDDLWRESHVCDISAAQQCIPYVVALAISCRQALILSCFSNRLSVNGARITCPDCSYNSICGQVSYVAGNSVLRCECVSRRGCKWGSKLYSYIAVTAVLDASIGAYVLC